MSSIVSISATWSPLPDETVQSSSSAAIDEREMSVRLSSSSSVVIPSFSAISSSVGARCSFASSVGDRALDVARAGAHGARHPVHRAQLVDDRALDPRDRVRLELHVAVGVVALDRADQAEQAVGDEVALVDVRGQAAAEAAGDELDERRVGQDQAVAQRAIARLPELAPESFGVFGHSDRAREYGAARRSPVLAHGSRAAEPGFLLTTAARDASPAIQSPIAAAAARMTHCPAAPAATAIPPNASASTRKSAPSARRCAEAATAEE